MPIPECPPEWRSALERHLSPQLPGFGITVREAATVLGVMEPTHMQLQQIDLLLKGLGWEPHALRKAGGGRTKVFLRGGARG